MAIAVLAACTSGNDVAKRFGFAKSAANIPIAVPKVSVATVLANDNGQPPQLLIIDASGTPRIAAAKTWADLDAHKVRIAARTAELRVLGSFMSSELGHDPLSTVALWDSDREDEINPPALRDTSDPSTGYQDDPPPPPPEMGDDPAPGPGRFEARHRGGCAEAPRGPWFREDDAWSIPPDANSTPWRVAETEGQVMRDGQLDRLNAMIIVAPTAKATALIDAVLETRGAIAVSLNGKIRPLHLQFGAYDTAFSEQSPYWIEVRVSSKEIVVEAVPDKPIVVTALDQVGTAIQQARAGQEGEPGAIDVLVDPDVDAQHLIDAIVAVDVAGASTIGIGPAPSANDLIPRGHRHVAQHASVGFLGEIGYVSRADIYHGLKPASPRIKACYQRALKVDPTLEGTLEAVFRIRADGSVGSATASGMSPKFAACVTRVIKSLRFPKSDGGGDTKVHFPYVFHPTGILID